MDFFALAQACAPTVDPKTLAAIVRTESGFKPFSIGINGGAKLMRQPKTKAEAVATAHWLIARGYSIDMGLGQINSANLPKLRLSVEDVFDPCKNLQAAATILQASYQKAKQAAQPGKKPPRFKPPQEDEAIPESDEAAPGTFSPAALDNIINSTPDLAQYARMAKDNKRKKP